MDQLAYDLTLHLHEPDIQAVLVRIIERMPGPATAPRTERGILRCKLEEVIRGKAGKPGVVLAVPYSRKTDPQAQAGASFNYWNMLPLEPGDLLVLVGRPSEDGKDWHALSGNQVASATDPVVIGLRECFRMEDLQGDLARQQAMIAGFVAGNPLVRRYVVSAVNGRETVPRDVACELYVRALGNGQLDDEGRLRAADALASAPIFDESAGDDAVNRRVVAALAGVVSALPGPDQQTRVVRYLASCALNDFAEDEAADRKIRAALLGSIAPTPPSAVADALARMQAGSPDDQEIAQDLLAAWQAPA